jgi:hypothetical protein
LPLVRGVVRAGKNVAEARALTGGGEEMGTIAGAVVAHEPLSFDAERSEVSESAFEEEERTVLAFIGHDLSKGEAGGVIGADIDIFPARATDLIAPIMSDAVTGPHDASELLISKWSSSPGGWRS